MSLILYHNEPQIIYENAASGESMVSYVELVNDCDNLQTFRIGEYLRLRVCINMRTIQADLQYSRL